MNPTTLPDALSEIARLKKELARLRGGFDFHDKVIKATSVMVATKGSITADDWNFILTKTQMDDPSGSQKN